MPLGNLTSQFFANIYLSELDYFVKHKLKVKYYVRYVDDFAVLHTSQKQLEVWKEKIIHFLNEKLKLRLHPNKSRIISLSRGVDFIGFRNFYNFKLTRKRCFRKMERRVNIFEKEKISYIELMKCFQGWNAHTKWANTYKLRKQIAGNIARIKHKKIEQIQKLGNSSNDKS
ncbi:MAG: RNA-directed DNA polymerase [archaeon]